MNLNVFVGERRVAALTSPDGFEHVLAYLPEATEADFVSLAMPVAQGAWRWPALHPFFQVSLPEGFLLSVLKERLGPHLGATPLELLSVVDHNMIGRVRVSVGERPATEAALPDLAPLLHGEHSKAVFLELMAEHAVSGVSGVVPKFLTPQTQALFRKGTVATERHIVEASSEHQPFVALNEHLCMQAAASCGVPVAATRVSDDGQVLVVERFDIDPVSQERRGFEDFCSLLGLAPEQKYNSTGTRPTRRACTSTGERAGMRTRRSGVACSSTWGSSRRRSARSSTKSALRSTRWCLSSSTTSAIPRPSHALGVERGHEAAAA